MKPVSATNVKKNKLTDRQCMVLIFIGCFFAHLIINPFIRTTCSLPTETASFSLAEYIAGHDWSELISNTDYYGVGFYALFFPLIKLITDRYLLHQAVLALVCAVECIPPLLCYKMMRRDFKIDSMKYCALSAIAVSFMDVVYTSAAINEHPLKVIIWLVIFLIFSIMNTDSKKRKAVYTLLLSLLMLYSLTMHARAVLIILVVGFTVVVYYIIYRKWIVNLPVFALLLIPGYFITKKCLRMAVSLLWNTSNGNSLRNSDGTILRIFGLTRELFGQDGIKGFLNTIFAQFFAANVYTVGLFFTFFVITIVVVIRAIKYRKNEEISERTNKILIIAVICMCAVLATVFANAIYTLKAAKILIAKQEGAKFYFFLRYFFFYLTPMFMALMVFIYHEYDIVRKWIFAVGAAFVFTIMYIFTFILPTTLTSPTLKLDAAYLLAPFSLRKFNEFMSPKDLFLAALVPLVIYVLIRYVFNEKRRNLFVLLIAILFAYEYYYVSFTCNYNMSEKNYQYVNGYLQTVYSNSNYKDINKKIYVMGSPFVAQEAQYEMPDMVIVSSNDKIETDGVTLINRMLNIETVQKFKFKYIYKLDSDEYMYSATKMYDFMQEIDFNTYETLRKQNYGQ